MTNITNVLYIYQYDYKEIEQKAPTFTSRDFF